MVETSQQLPDSYIQIEQIAQRLIAPLAALMEEGKSALPIKGMASDHGEPADKFEAYARPCMMAAIWLQTPSIDESRDAFGLSREEVAAWFRSALLLGTDPKSPEFWGYMQNYDQVGVEMAILAMSLEIADEWLWNPLSQSEKAQVAEWLGWMRGSGHHWNNHLFFGVLVLEFLRARGFEEPGDGQAIDFLFQHLECMYQGDGWFIDGVNQSFDHYNAYAFHTYGQWWAHQYGHTNPERAERWKNWAAEFIQDYAHFYAASGEHLAYGRSITYRFNGLGVFGLAALHGTDTLPKGMMRRICRKNLEFFMGQPFEQAQGCLSVGWTDHFEGIAEPYSCAGSPYWAAKGLMMLLIDPSDEFWTVDEVPYPAEEGDFVRKMPIPGFVVRSLDGEIDLVNAGTQICLSNTKRYGAWKWSKHAYRTGHGFQVWEDGKSYPLDAALTVSLPGSSYRYGRRDTMPTAIEEDHISYYYVVGDNRDEMAAMVRTWQWWNGRWLLTLHRVKAPQPVIVTLGAFSLGIKDPASTTSESEGMVASASAPEGISVGQGLLGFDEAKFEKRLDESRPRTNLRYPYHITPYLESAAADGTHLLAGLIYFGADSEEAKPWNMISAEQGHWSFNHDKLGPWEINHVALPSIAT